MRYVLEIPRVMQCISILISSRTNLSIFTNTLNVFTTFYIILWQCLNLALIYYQVEMLKNFAGDKTRLGTAEKFLNQLIELPR